MLVEKAKNTLGTCRCAAGDYVSPCRVSKSLDKGKKITKQNHYVHACDLFVETALADVTVTIPRVRLVLQYDGRLIQQIILSKC